MSRVRVGRSFKPLRHVWLWAFLWMLAIAAVVAGSLVPPQDLAAAPQVNDKLQHFLGYFVLMAAAVQLYARRASWVVVALALVGMGIGLEYLQADMHVGRTSDRMDALANTLGVIAGFGTGLTPLRDLLLRWFPATTPSRP